MSGIVGSRLNIRGSGVVGKLGTDGQVFTSAGAGKSAVFEAAAAGGKVLQIVGDHSLTANTSTSNSWANIPDPAVTLTPASSSSKIALYAFSNYFNANSAWAFWSFRRAISGGSTTDDPANAGGSGSYGIAKSDDAHNRSWCLTWLDEPSTTSAVTYTIIFKSTSSHTIYTGTAADRIGIYAIEYES